MSEQGRRWTLIGICGLALVLRIWGLEAQSLWRDEIDAIRFASGELSDLAAMFITPGQNGPLYFALLRAWLDLVGSTEFGLRFLSVAAGVLTVPLVYALCRLLFPRLRPIGTVAALLAATSPYLVWYSQEGKMYALVVALVLLSMGCYVGAVREGGHWRWAVYILATIAALYVHLTVALLLVVQLVGYPLLARDRWRETRRLWMVSILIVGLAYLPLLAWEIPHLLERASTGYGFVPFHDMAQTLLVSYSLGVVRASPHWLLAPSLCLLLAAPMLKDRKVSAWALTLVVIWLVVPVVTFFGISLLRPMFTARYLVLVLPPYLVLLAVGFVSVVRRTRSVAVLLLAGLLAASGWGLYLQYTTPIKTDFRGATRHLREAMSPADLLVFQIPHGRYGFEYYTQSIQEAEVPQSFAGSNRLYLPAISGGGRARYRWVDGLYTNGGMESTEVGLRMERLVDDAKVIWLVATEVDMWDQRALVQGWLDENAALLERTDFVGISTLRYERE